MGCNKLTYRNFDFLEVVHRKNATAFKKNHCNENYLGNVRLSYADSEGNGSINPSSEIISEKNYYPFGLQHKGYNTTLSGNRNSVAENFGYNGKENNPELGIEWMDFGARNYDAALGRWMNIDPMSEKYFNQSPYIYALNNPVFFVDPDGREVDVTALIESGNEDDFWLLINLAANLSDISGQEINFTTKDGQTTLTGDAETCKTNCNEASAFVSHLLDPNGETITVAGSTKGSNGGLPSAPNHINLDAKQINGFQVAAEEAGYDGEAFNVGFSFLHEAVHTKRGSDFFNTPDYNKLKGLDGTFNDGRKSGIPEGSSVTNIINRFRRDARVSTTRPDYGFGTPGTLHVEKDGNKEVLQNVEPISPTQN